MMVLSKHLKKLYKHTHNLPGHVYDAIVIAEA